jgi:hypothetical protein
MRGVATASVGDMWKSCQLVRTWKIDVAIREPPGVPITTATRPSWVRIVGVMVDSGRLPGAIAFASPPTTPSRFGAPGLAELRSRPVSSGELWTQCSAPGRSDLERQDQLPPRPARNIGRPESLSAPSLR